MDRNKARNSAEDAVVHASHASDPRDMANGAGQFAIAQVLMYVGDELALLCGAVEAIGRDGGPLHVLTERKPS